MKLCHIMKALEFIKERNQHLFKHGIYVDDMNVERYNASVVIDNENNICTKSYYIFREGHILRISEIATGDKENEDPVKSFVINLEIDDYVI